MIKETDISALMDAVDMLKALSNPNRLAILCHLSESEKSVSEIAESVDLSQSALSQHLAKLRDLGLVTTRREQQSIYYSLSSHEAETVIASLHGLYCK